MQKYADLLKKYGSPLYVYDKYTIDEACTKLIDFKEELEERLQREVGLHYSTKSNSNPAILKMLKAKGLKVDAMSPFELEVNERCGFSHSEILYVCNNISMEEMEFVHGRNVLICLDSISQVEQWGKLFPGTNIMVRINPGIVGVGHSKSVITAGKETKFGICENNLPYLLSMAKNYNLNIVGVHQHLGSLFLNDKIKEYVSGVEAGLNIVKKYFKHVSIIDLGGGFGVPYKPKEEKLDFWELKNEMLPVLEQFVKDYPEVKEVKFEPGRFIPCEAGFLIGKVNAIKYESNTWWIGTDVGMNQLVRPSMYGSYHEIEILSENEDDVIANIVGNVCESGDILGKNRLVKIPEIGDIVVVHNAGAYGYSMASNYTGRPRPAEILIDNDVSKLIRKRETLEDLMRNIIW